jgi:hypothetical protein
VRTRDALLLGMRGGHFRQSHILLFVHRRLSGVKENRRAERNAELKVNLTVYKPTIEYIIIYTCTVLSLLIGGKPACV